MRFVYIFLPQYRLDFFPEADSLLEQPFEMRRLQTIHEVSAHRGQDQYFQAL